MVKKGQDLEDKVIEVPVKEEGTNLNYKAVDQGTEEQPALQETSTAEIGSEAKEKKSKGGKKSSAGTKKLSMLRDQIRCGMCNNFMTQSENINVFDIKGKKIPKGIDKKPLWESPGGSTEYTPIGVLCDDCVRISNTTAKKIDGSGSAVDIKSAIAIKRDGTVQMVPLQDLE